MLFGGRQLRKLAALCFIAGAVDRAERRAIKIGKRRPHIENARLQQCLFGRDRNLLVDEIGDAGILGAGHESFAHRIERGGLIRCQGAQRHIIGSRLARREHHFGAADCKGKRAKNRALQEGAPLDVVHDFLPTRTTLCRRLRDEIQRRRKRRIKPD
ncbi:MAG: hypothetical protein WA889_02520 [Xanthobacteraceae bacterium]